MEIKELKNEEIKGTPPNQLELLTNDLTGMTDIKENVRFLISQASAPTYIPRTPLEHFFLYNSAGTRRLYVYDKSSGSWHYASLT